MRILISGGKGMLARSIHSLLTQNGYEVFAPGHTELDITNPISVGKAFSSFAPDVAVHCAAMTAVDKCETEREKAFLVNDAGCANMAQACQGSKTRLISFSTDYVFDGKSSKPYSEFDQPTGGESVYGQSKWAGECAIRLACPNHLIARVSWLYGPGGPSFLHTMMRLATQGKSLKVVDDQHGNPTSTLAVARAVLSLIERPELRGTFHLSCEGETTWYGFAKEIFSFAGLSPELRPCTSEEYPLPAKRPANSRLEKRRLNLAGIAPMPNWKDALAEFMSLEFPNGAKGCSK